MITAKFYITRFVVKKHKEGYTHSQTVTKECSRSLDYYINHYIDLFKNKDMLKAGSSDVHINLKLIEHNFNKKDKTILSLNICEFTRQNTSQNLLSRLSSTNILLLHNLKELVWKNEK